MNENIKQSADLFLENLETAKNEFPWESTGIRLLCAMAFSAKGMKMDLPGMKAANELIQKKTGIFSEFRGNIKLMLAVRMTLSGDMEAYLDHVQAVYNLLTRGKWFSLEPEHYVIAGMVIAQNSGTSLTDEECTERMRSIFARMKENHPWLTDDEDLGFAALLAVSGLAEDSVVTEMENCYRYLKEKKIFTSDNGLQSLSHVLSLSTGNFEEKCDKTAAIYNALKEKKKKYGPTYELSTLGAFAFAAADSRVLSDEIAETDDYLKSDKNFKGLFGIEEKQRLMYAAILVVQQYCAADSGVETAALSGIASMIAAEQASTTMILCSCIATTV